MAYIAAIRSIPIVHRVGSSTKIFVKLPKASIMGSVDYGDIIHIAENKILNATEINLKKPQKLPKETSKINQNFYTRKIFCGPTSSIKIKNTKNYKKKLTSTLLLTACRAVFLTYKIL